MCAAVRCGFDEETAYDAEGPPPSLIGSQLQGRCSFHRASGTVVVSIMRFECLNRRKKKPISQSRMRSLGKLPRTTFEGYCKGLPAHKITTRYRVPH